METFLLPIEVSEIWSPSASYIYGRFSIVLLLFIVQFTCKMKILSQEWHLNKQWRNTQLYGAGGSYICVEAFL